MSHELMFDDHGKAAMFYVDEKRWHREGTKLERPPTAGEAIRAAKLDWTLAKAPPLYHSSLIEERPPSVALVPAKE